MLDTTLLQWVDNATGQGLLQLISRGGPEIARGAVFLLVAARLAGILGIGPWLGRSLLPWPARIGLVILLTLVVAPGVPLPVLPPDVIQASHQNVGSLPTDDSTTGSLIDLASPTGLIVAIVCEFGAGAAIGLMVAVFLSGIRLGGEWLDRHSGLGMGSILNPEYSAGGSAPAELAWLFCIISIAIMQPINGHLLFVRTVIDLFHVIPVGAATIPVSLLELTRLIVVQSLTLGLRIAMPFVVAMALLDMTLGWIRRSSRWDLTPVAYSLRVAASLMILAATIPGIQESVTSSLNEAFKLTDDLSSG